MENLIPSIFSSYDNAVSSSELENSTSKLDDIIKRLNSSNIPPITRIKTEPVDSDEENLVCRAADASTQTSLNFIKVRKDFILP